MKIAAISGIWDLFEPACFFINNYKFNKELKTKLPREISIDITTTGEYFEKELFIAADKSKARLHIHSADAALAEIMVNRNNRRLVWKFIIDNTDYFLQGRSNKVEQDFIIPVETELQENGWSFEWKDKTLKRTGRKVSCWISYQIKTRRRIVLLNVNYDQNRKRKQLAAFINLDYLCQALFKFIKIDGSKIILYSFYKEIKYTFDFLSDEYNIEFLETFSNRPVELLKKNFDLVNDMSTLDEYKIADNVNPSDLADAAVFFSTYSVKI